MRTGKEENFWIWDQVKNTNPKYTKAFTKFGGKELTTIDPMYQIQVILVLQRMLYCGMGSTIRIRLIPACPKSRRS